MIAVPADARASAPASLRRFIAGSVLVAAALMLLAQTLATSDRPTLAVVWGGLALAAYAFGLMCLIGLGHGTDLGLARWKIGSWTLLWCGVVFGIATVTWSQPQTGTAAQIAVPDVLRALLLVAVGITALSLGYWVGPGQPVCALATRALWALRGRFAAEVRSPAAPWVLYAIGIAARLASAATTGRFGYVGDASSGVSTASGYAQVLSDFSLCAPLAVAAAAMQVFRERLPGARITLAVLFLVELAFGATAGGKQNFIIAVLAVVIPFCAARRRLPKVALIAGAAVFVMIVIPFNQAYRNAARGGSVTLTPSQAIHEAPGIIRHTLAFHNVLTALPGSVSYLLHRIREIDNPAVIMQRTPGQIAFISPVQLIQVPLDNLVPRAIWPGKPLLTAGYQFGQEYYGAAADIYSTDAITPVGDLYRHGGWVPVLVGMLLLGCGIRLLDDVIDVRGNPHTVLLVLLFLPGLVKAESDLVTLVAGMPASVVIWVLAVALTFRARRRA